MATPTHNAVSTTTFNPALTGDARYLLQAVKWGGALGSPVTLTFSFPGAAAVHADPYAGQSGSSEWDGLAMLTVGEQALTRAALTAWTRGTGLTFAEVEDSATTVGELRIAKSTTLPSGEPSHTYAPSADPSAGDVWLNTATFNAGHLAVLSAGTLDYVTLLREVGTALGLKDAADGPNVMPDAHDNLFYTVMSHSARIKGDSGIASSYPTTPMYDDLVAIHALYGRDPVATGDTSWSFSDQKTYFQTIDDSNGVDTITATGLSRAIINLNPGAFCGIGRSIMFDSGPTRMTVAIGPDTIIENATGGAGSDSITGNAANNLFKGGLGHDTMRGGAGNDTFFGGLGNDRLYGGTGADRFFFTEGLSSPGHIINTDFIFDFNSADGLYLSRTIFGKLAAGPISASHFWLGAAAHDADDYIVYNKINGHLSYDIDGSGAGVASLIAVLTPNTALTTADIIAY